MSKRHQASRRRTYGRRQHELRERRDRTGRMDEMERQLAEDGFAPREATAADDRWTVAGATWLGLE